MSEHMTSTIKLRCMDELLSVADSSISRTRMLFRPEKDEPPGGLLETQLRELAIKLAEVRGTLNNRLFERKCNGEETF